MTSKLQVTLPKPLAEQLGVRPGDEFDWEVSARALHIVPRGASSGLAAVDRAARFRASVERQLRLQAERGVVPQKEADRGWTRDELYDLGNAD